MSASIRNTLLDSKILALEKAKEFIEREIQAYIEMKEVEDE